MKYIATVTADKNMNQVRAEIYEALQSDDGQRVFGFDSQPDRPIAYVGLSPVASTLELLAHAGYCEEHDTDFGRVHTKQGRKWPVRITTKEVLLLGASLIPHPLFGMDYHIEKPNAASTIATIAKRDTIVVQQLCDAHSGIRTGAACVAGTLDIDLTVEGLAVNVEVTWTGIEACRVEIYHPEV